MKLAFFYLKSIDKPLFDKTFDGNSNIELEIKS